MIYLTNNNYMIKGVKNMRPDDSKICNRSCR